MQVRFGIRQTLAVVSAMVVVIIGSGLILMPEPWFWFRAGLGVLMYGQAFKQLALSRSLTRIRQRLGLSVVRGIQVWCVAYIAAGGLFIIGAVTSLERVFAAIVAFAAFCWMWIWAWCLGQSGKWIEPKTATSSDQTITL